MPLGDSSKVRRKALGQISDSYKKPLHWTIEWHFECARKTHKQMSDKMREALFMPSDTWRDAQNRSAALDEAYCLVRNYMAFALEAIPKHSSYGADGVASEREELERCAEQSTARLNQITAAMDADERLLQAEIANRETPEAEHDAPQLPSSAPTGPVDAVAENVARLGLGSPPGESSIVITSMQGFQSDAAQAWARIRRSNRGRTELLTTRQGQNQSSSNGCTVIAILACAGHLAAEQDLTNDDLATIIDEHAPCFLALIRDELGLSDASLLVFDDVHQKFLDEYKLLDASWFMAYQPGNCLDKEKVESFLDKFAGVPETHKAACAFYFNEYLTQCEMYETRVTHWLIFRHIVAILRVGQEYHFVDSMPLRGEGPDVGHRTVCADIEALRVFLLYYVSRKLPESCLGIPWDESNHTIWLDKRVFQAWLWKKKAP